LSSDFKASRSHVKDGGNKSKKGHLEMAIFCGPYNKKVSFSDFFALLEKTFLHN